MKRWSSLQRELYRIIDEKLDFQIHLTKYRMNSRFGSTDLPRCFITLDDEIIFDYPRQFVGATDQKSNLAGYPYLTDTSNMTAFLRTYIDTPKEELFEKHFENDLWGLSDILKAADKRIGARRLERLRQQTDHPAAQKIIAKRLRTEIPNTHTMRLAPDPFERIKNGTKTIELRLLDEKRKRIHPGDEIIFVNTGDPSLTLHARVVELSVFDSFAELYKHLPLADCGYDEDELADARPEDMEVYYPKEKQQQYGVVGIRIRLWTPAE